MLGEWSKADDLVFSHVDGSPILPDTVTHAFYRIAANAGLYGFTLHSLRHTHATVLFKRKTPPKVVQERLGHADISTTLDIYTHLVPGMQEEAAASFEQELQEADELVGVDLAQD